MEPASIKFWSIRSVSVEPSSLHVNADVRAISLIPTCVYRRLLHNPGTLRVFVGKKESDTYSRKLQNDLATGWSPEGTKKRGLLAWEATHWGCWSGLKGKERERERKREREWEKGRKGERGDLLTSARRPRPRFGPRGSTSFCDNHSGGAFGARNRSVVLINDRLRTNRANVNARAWR